MFQDEGHNVQRRHNAHGMRREKNMEMKKRLIIFSMVVMAFLAMPLLRVSAASESGKMGGTELYGAVNIYEGYADANAGCDDQDAIATVTLTYEYINEDTHRLESQYSMGYGSGSVVTTLSKPQGDYRSYRATATYNIKLEEYRWSPGSQSIYY